MNETVLLDSAAATAAIDPATAGELHNVATTLQRAGFSERMVCAWFGVPLVSDARHVAPSKARSRRGLGGYIALLVAGETIEASALGLLDEAEWAALTAVGLVERDGQWVRARASIVPVGAVLVAADRLDARSPDAVLSPDVSAWNLAASLPASIATLLDVGTGSGAVALTAARRGARVVGTDVDRRALGYAQLNAHLNGVELSLLEGDLFAGVVGRFDVVAFNAPLVRAELAGDRAAPLYLSSPRGEALLVDFLAGARARTTDAGEALLHAQLTPAVDEAAFASGYPRRLAIHFADAPDGTPHALLSLGASGAPGASRVRVPLGEACPHLRRELVERLHVTRDLAAARFLRPQSFREAVLRPPPWLELTRQEVHDGRSFRPRATRLGAVRLDGEELGLVERCDGRKVIEVAPDEAALERLATLADRGLLVL